MAGLVTMDLAKIAQSAPLPRKFWRYGVGGYLIDQLRSLSPRQRWLAEHTRTRWERRPGNAGKLIAPDRGELGRIDGIRIVSGGPFAPPP